MLDSETKRRIDSARDILVGKVPDPKSQVEQITIALIYKFMDDMDAESEELGGERKFFAGEFGKYGWAKLMRPGVGGHEMLGLYAEAIQRMPENPGIPPLFRSIFNNAYLPYRDPETLRAFLKVIDEFEYDHSERLGDAFEYLLSVLGSQGDAGQFRTPRHIIEFMVDIVDPKKNEKVLDPACGTGGFVISAWKHILEANTDANGQSTLTPDERAALANNFIGYDISPDMVRLSLVNMYLHGFANPEIAEYDTLTSQEKWNEHADVILANPPFMSPKGGIKPHNRFGVQSKRSEVLFVDYMAEHLTSNGRAGIIVPEGVIFQAGTAYRKLRELLVERFLIGVISLPSGVFMPYTGVKTSILIFDRAQAKRNPSILFSEVKHIGMSLGVKRTATEFNDLPTILNDYRAYYHDGELSKSSWVASRDEVEANDFVLTGGRYRPETSRADQHFVRIGDVCTITKGRFSSTKTPPGPYPLILTAADAKSSEEYQLEGPAVCVPLISSLGHGKAALHRIHYVDGKFALANLLVALLPRDHKQIDIRFLYNVLDFRRQDIAALMRGAANVGMKPADLEQFQVPLPSPEKQREIVAEIEGYQKVIDGARAVVENYRPHIAIDPDWPVVELGTIVSFASGGTPSKSTSSYWHGEIPWVSAKDMKSDVLHDSSSHVSLEAVNTSATKVAPIGALLILVRGMGLANGVPICELAVPCAFNQDVKAMQPSESVNSTFLKLILDQSRSQFDRIIGTAAHGTLKIGSDDLSQMKIPLPPLAMQHALVTEIRAEQSLVAVNLDLVERFEKKIETALERVWGVDANEGVCETGATETRVSGG